MNGIKRISFFLTFPHQYVHRNEKTYKRQVACLWTGYEANSLRAVQFLSSRLGFSRAVGEYSACHVPLRYGLEFPLRHQNSML